MRVLLHDNQICERGTTTSLLDYGRVLQQRGHDIAVSYWSGSSANVPAVIERVGREFPLLAHPEPDYLPASLGDFDAAYLIKAGLQDGILLPEAHNLVHAVFQEYDPHGSRYVYISEWLARAVRERVDQKGNEELREFGAQAVKLGCANALAFEHLDLIVDIPEPQSGIRQQLGIPEEAFTILRFGGYDTFDIGWAQQTVVRLLDENPHWYFVGLNTAPFTDHKRALFLPLVPDNVEKASIIAASDVFLTARGQGEAFGVAIAEALQIGIPVLAWNGGIDQNHIAMLKGLGGLFQRPWDLRRRLRRLGRGKDPSSRIERQERGNQYRPDIVGPKLEQLLTDG